MTQVTVDTFFVAPHPTKSGRYAVFNAFGKLSSWLTRRRLQAWVKDLADNSVIENNSSEGLTT